MPKRENVVFFACAAAAAEAGFRPCLRCRPETSPGTPAWLGTSATVSRALRLIADGALDHDSVERLAERMGLGGRHLRRLFLRHLGATPTAVAQTRRLHFAKRLLDETRLPMTQVSHAAGFRSVRRFNDSIRSAYGRTPSELRRARRARRAEDGSAHDDADLILKLPYRAPLDWNALLSFLGPRAIAGVEHVDRRTLRRAVVTEEGDGVVEVRPAPAGDGLILVVPSGLSGRLAGIVERARSVFDLGADPAEIGAVLRADSLLARRLRRHPGPRVPGAWDGFELAVRAVLGQQVSVRGATTLAGRLVQSHGKPLTNPAAGITHRFPLPAVIAGARLESIGLPSARAGALRALARAVLSGALVLESSEDPDAVRTALMEISGIGPWTAEYVAMRALRAPDAFPASDLGLRKGASTNGAPLPARELEARSHAWRPWRAYAAMLLWQGDEFS